MSFSTRHYSPIKTFLITQDSMYAQAFGRVTRIMEMWTALTAKISTSGFATYQPGD
jgi:hypothetical protein